MININKLFLVLFSILIGCDVHAIQLPVSSNFKVLYEQKFNKEIDEVAFDSYEKDGSITYYPKIVVFKERDDFTVKIEYKDEKHVVKREKQEIMIFSPQESEITNIKGPTITSFQGGEIYISEGGNYFAILQTTIWDYFYSDMTQFYFSQDEIDSILEKGEKGRTAREKREKSRNKLNEFVREKYEAEHGKLEETNLSVYNDEGEMLWRKEPWKDIPYDADYAMKISPKDGSLFFGLLGLEASWIYEPNGTRKKAFPPELHEYIPQDLGFARNWEYIAIGFKEEPTHFYKELPGRSSKPGGAFLDSNWNLLWKKSLNNYLISGVVISPYGSYLAAETYTMKGTGEKGEESKIESRMAVNTGYLFDRKGELIMNPTLGGGLGRNTLSLFSENEKYFAARDDKHLSFIDIENKKIIFEKEFPSRIWAISVSNKGRCALLAGHKVYMVDENGHEIWESGTALNEISVHSIHLLGWDNNNPIIGVIVRETGEIEIGKVLVDQGK